MTPSGAAPGATALASAFSTKHTKNATSTSNIAENTEVDDAISYDSAVFAVSPSDAGL